MTPPKDDGGPAFPMPSGDEPRVNTTTHYNEGMSLRDYFAAKAMAAIYAGRSPGDWPNSEMSAWVVEEAYGIADAMLAARKGAK